MIKKIALIIKRVLSGIGIIFIGLILFVLIISPIINDHEAKKIVKEIQNIELPQETKLIETYSDAGKLCGNGNGMQYFGALLIQSSLSLEELKEYYSKFDDRDYYNVVEPQDGRQINQIEHQNRSFKTEDIGEDYYIVYTWGDYNGISSELDLRGN